ncbi:MAG: hypothetical protein ACON4T_01465 [Synechococcus sp.]
MVLALPRSLCLAFAGLTTLVLVQQQVLLRRAPRLHSVAVQPLRSGPAALDVRFSRPMQPASVETFSRLHPDLSHRWFGENAAWRLLLDQPDPTAFPLRVDLSGQDLRGLSLKPQSLYWDPRPTLLAVESLEGGQQHLTLLQRDGSWAPLTPKFRDIVQIEPLGNGQGVAFVATDDQGDQFVAMRHLIPRALGLAHSDLASPALGPLEALTERGQLFGYVSSNLRGDLLVQAGQMQPGRDQLWVRRADQQRFDLELQRSGPIRLLPDGTGLVVPDYDGLVLQSFKRPDRQSWPRQILPGRRDLRAFCTGSGRALLVRHWPDYRRSVELVIPGLSPRQIWLGEEAVIAVACDNGGERLWVVLRDGVEEPHDTLLQLDRDGTVQQRHSLTPWRLSPDSGLHFDPVSDQLLFTVIRALHAPGRLARLSSSSMTLQVDRTRSVTQVALLPASGRIDRF